MDARLARGKATKATIIEAARDLFGAYGYDGTSIDAILRRAGVARGALYHHFPTKEAVFDAVLEHEVEKIADASAQAARAADDPVGRLRAGCRTWLEIALDPAIQRIVLLDSPAVVGWTRWREVDEKYTLGGLRAAIKQIAGTGRIPTDQADMLANMLGVAVSEAALVIARSGNTAAALRTGLAALDTLLDSLFGYCPACGAGARAGGI